MHELPVMAKILAVACRHAEKHGVSQIRSITLGVGIFSDLEPEWMQRYFDRISRETVASGALLKVQRMPALFQCGLCQMSFSWTDRHAPIPPCPTCGAREDAKLVSGAGYQVLEMEAFS